MVSVTHRYCTPSNVILSGSVEAQSVIPGAANVVRIFVALAIVLPEADGADVEVVVEGPVVAAGAEDFLCLRYVFFVVVRVGVCVRGVRNDKQSTCCVRHLRRGETV